MKTALNALLLAVAFSAAGQDVLPNATFAPTEPTDRDRIQSTIRLLGLGGCTITPSTTISGTTIRTTIRFHNCTGVGGPPPVTFHHREEFGPVAAGTYIYELYEIIENNSPNLVSQQALVVAATPIVPVFRVEILALLGLLLATIGLSLARRL